MANFCSFEIRIKGKRGNALLLANSIPTIGRGSFDHASGNNDDYFVIFRGSCKWSVNFNVTDDWNGSDIDIDLNMIPESHLVKLAGQYTDFSLRAKSRVLQCEVMVHYWSDESGFDYFDHFINGRREKKRRIPYDSSNAFDWDTLEFIGHEGESEDEDNKEAVVLMHANRFVRNFDPATLVHLLMDQSGDVSEADEEDEESETEEDNTSIRIAPSGDHYNLNSAVRLLISDDFSLEKELDSEGNTSLELKVGKDVTGGNDEFLFSYIIADNTLKPGDGNASKWIENTIRGYEDEQYIHIPGQCPVLISITKLRPMELLGITIRSFMLKICVFYNNTQYLSFTDTCIMRDRLLSGHRR